MEVEIGAVVPLTGRYAALGAQIRAGYEIAVEQVNASGGVSLGGKKMPLELVMMDDESDPTKTVARLETLTTQGVVAYLGGAGSDLHAAAASIGDKNKIPYLGVAFALHSIHKQGLRYLFSPFPKSPDLTKNRSSRLAVRAMTGRRASYAQTSMDLSWLSSNQFQQDLAPLMSGPIASQLSSGASKETENCDEWRWSTCGYSTGRRRGSRITNDPIASRQGV